MTPRRHYWVPDLQLAPGDPTDHLDWIAKDIVRRKPDVLVLGGDVWQFDSLSSHSAPGSLEKEGARISDDIEAGNAGMARLMGPINAEIARLRHGRRRQWKPRKVYVKGNHEHRLTRTLRDDPRWIGVISEQSLDIEKHGFERHDFLVPVEIDGIWYSHYWQSEKSDRPIGGSMDNRLNKICRSYFAGHEQGLLMHRRPLPVGKTIHGIVAGSCYLKAESYRGAQRNNEWRGVVVAQDVRDGDFEPMPLTLRYLCRTYGGEELVPYMNKRYPGRDWSYLDR